MKSVRYVAIVAVGGMGSIWGTRRDERRAELPLAARATSGRSTTRCSAAVLLFVMLFSPEGILRLDLRAALAAACRAPARRRGRGRVTALLEVSGALEALRRRAGREGRLLPRGEGDGEGAHRPERRGQDDALQPRLRGWRSPDAGAVRLRGEAIQGHPPHRIAALGLARTFQHIRLFGQMTALENVMVGRHVRSRAGFVAGMLHLPWTWREEREIERAARDALEFLGAGELADARGHEPLVRPAARGRARARARRRAGAAAPRRARGRPQHARDGGAREARSGGSATAASPSSSSSTTWGSS